MLIPTDMPLHLSTYEMVSNSKLIHQDKHLTIHELMQKN
jgi:hypothetical protein